MKNILLVDNDRIFLRLTRRLLEKEGHHVETADDGLVALDILKTYIPDVIFVDLVMPNIDGRTLCRIIRGKTKLNNTAIIVLSATFAEDLTDFPQVDVNACIAKGTFNETAKNIISVLNRPGLISGRSSPGDVVGLENVYPRGITKELLSVKRHFELMLDRMSEGILEINLEGRIVYVNTAASSLIGMPEKDLLGSFFVTLFTGDDCHRISHLMKIEAANFKMITDEDPVKLDKTLVALNIIPLDEEKNRYIIILHDVTKRKKAEAALRKAHDELEQRVEDRTFELKRVNTQLKIEIEERRQIEEERKILIEDLKKALNEVKTLRGILPVCSFCKKVRDDKGFWNQIDAYITEHSEADISHGVCPECAEKYYPDMGLYDDEQDQE